MLIIKILLAASLIVAPVQAAPAKADIKAAWTATDLQSAVSRVKATLAVGQPIPRIVCPEGFEPLVYATDVTSPGGLAFDPNGVLHVAEENAGRVSRIGSDGTVQAVVTELEYPEGIAFDPAGNLYVVEDIENGRLLRIDPQGRQTVLAEGLSAPEGVVWAADEKLYITESNVQYIENIPWDVVTGVTRVSQGGEVAEVLTDALFWSYSAIAFGADGWLYVANEASNIGTTDSIFQVDPVTGTRVLFTSDLTAPEGLSFSPGSAFPLYVTEEELDDGTGRLNMVRESGVAEVLCTGLDHPEGVAVDKEGNIYITDKRQIVQILAPDLLPPGPPQEVHVDPAEWTGTDDFTLTWTNPADPSGIAGAFLKVGAPPTAPDDGAFNAGEALTQWAGIKAVQAGTQPAYLWLKDGAGNADHTRAVQVTLQYDPEPPGSPLQLAPNPAGWSTTNNFGLTWSNPPDLSGVATACYRLEAPSLVPADFDGCQAGSNIEALEGVTVPDCGEYTAFVWLADAAGNADPATATSTALRFDAIPPWSVTAAPTSTQIAPIQVSWVATDTDSGLESVMLWVKKGDSGTWTDSGLSSRVDDGPAPSVTSQGFFLYEPFGQDVYYFRTQAIDRAGNTEVGPPGQNHVRTYCQTWQRVYLPLLLRGGP